MITPATRKALGEHVPGEDLDGSVLETFLGRLHFVPVDAMSESGWADLKATLAHFAREFFGTSTRVRFRPSYFPFTEPSAEMDVRCDRSGSEIKIGQGDDWLEIAGCGMVHPQVFENVGYDPEVWTGWAFGFGIERIAMLRYGINDIRLFYENDVRFLKQF